MKIILDTCIVSDMYRGHQNLHAAINAIGEENCFLSVITLGEVARGIYLLNDGKKKKDLLYWIEDFEKQYANRIIPIDTDIAKTWGEITAKCKAAGKMLSIADGLIAASAICRGYHIMTENTKDFEPTGALLINP